MIKADIGIIGGSGFYDLAEKLQEIKVETPYGSPSDLIAVGKVADKKVAFLPRHGKNHTIPPHLINYRANIWALKSLGVKQILTSHAVGSLQTNYKPGDFVVFDQFVDRTRGRPDTYYDGQLVTHISTAFPYCPELRRLAIKQLKIMKLPYHSKGTVVVIQGPRFSTAAESSWFTKMGWDAVNMTEYPEVALARELEVCYLAIGLVTDYDSGIVTEGKVEPVTTTEIVKNFHLNIEKIKSVLKSLLTEVTPKRGCPCANALANARF